MILRFGLGNHYSVKDYQDISLVASSLKDEESALLGVTNEDEQGALRAIPVAAIYGANASGKSSILNGLSSIAYAVRDSHTSSNESEGTPFHPFALKLESTVEPSTFDIDFVLDDTRFHYGFSVDGKRIVSEWLYSFPLTTRRQTRSVLFYRDADESEPFHFGKALRGENKAIAKLVRPNSLFVSAAAQNAHPAITPIFDYFVEKITTRNAREPHDLATQIANYIGKNEDKKNQVVTFLKAADVGICDIRIETKPLDQDQIQFRDELSKLVSNHIPNLNLSKAPQEHTSVRLLHAGENGQNFPINLDSESAGTRTLLTLLGSILDKLEDGGTLIIDELDSTLHPLLSRQLLKLFSSPSTNPGKAQLIFSTHDTNLLAGRLLRRDQIFLTEKDNAGATQIYSLSEIKVRSSENMEAGYLSGRYGAIPFLGFDRVLQDMRHVARDE